MREIKFRAIPLFGESFVFGSLIIEPNERGEDTYIIRRYENGSVCYFEVKKETIGQYTGLKDKNSVEIYEGDIVSFTLFDCFDNDMQHIGKILFNNGAFYIEYMDKCELYNSLLCYVISQDDEFEVIGNIYENSDVLKG